MTRAKGKIVGAPLSPSKTGVNVLVVGTHPPRGKRAATRAAPGGYFARRQVASSTVPDTDAPLV